MKKYFSAFYVTTLFSLGLTLSGCKQQKQIAPISFFEHNICEKLDVTVKTKALSTPESSKLFRRKISRLGFTAINLEIKNNSENNVCINTMNFSTRLIQPSKVFKKIRRKKRKAFWTAFTILGIPLIPLSILGGFVTSIIVYGIFNAPPIGQLCLSALPFATIAITILVVLPSAAISKIPTLENRSLQKTLTTKCLDFENESVTIEPGYMLQGIVFINKNEKDKLFEITLENQNTRTKEVYVSKL